MVRGGQIGKFFSTIGRVARDRFTVPAAIVLIIGLAGADPFKDVVYGKTAIGSAWHTFLANLNTLLDNGLVRLLLIVLGLFLLLQSARRITVADAAQAAKAAAQAAALADKNNEARRELVGQIKHLIDEALNSLRADAAKALRVSVITGRVAELGLRLATAEPHLTDAQTEFEAFAQQLENADDSSLEVKSNLACRSQATRRAILAGFDALGEGRIMMLGSAAGGPSDADFYKQKLGQLAAGVADLQERIAYLRAERARGLEELRQILQ